MPRFLRCWLAFICLCSPIVLLAQTAAPAHMDAQSDRIARLEQQIADSKGSADNAWMLMCSALVLLMTGPGLALFYGGLVRKKNVLATMMQSFALMAVVTVVWAIPGQTFMVYQLMFAIITPALITGAFAERMKFSAMILFMVLWSLVVYSPMAHMVWGKGGF